jgi:hypothetical protein
MPQDFLEAFFFSILLVINMIFFEAMTLNEPIFYCKFGLESSIDLRLNKIRMFFLSIYIWNKLISY